MSYGNIGKLEFYLHGSFLIAFLELESAPMWHQPSNDFRPGTLFVSSHSYPNFRQNLLQPLEIRRPLKEVEVSRVLISWVQKLQTEVDERTTTESEEC